VSSRVSLDPFLPVDTDPPLRRAISEALVQHAKQINWLSQETTIVSSAAEIAHDIVLADASATAVACTLLPAVEWRDKVLRFKTIDAPDTLVTMVAQTGETIDGAQTVTLSAQYQIVSVMSSGDAWFKV